MATLDDWDVQVAARLTSHEFLLEILYAHWFAQLPVEAASSIAAEIIRKTRSSYVAADSDQQAVEDAGVQVALDSQVMTERFFAKVEERAHQIRPPKA